MKKQFNKLAGWLICIAFAVFLLYIKDNMGYIWGALTGLAAILTPFICGFGIAYIMNFPYRFFKKKVFDKVKAKWFKKISKALSLIIAYVLVLGVITVLISVLVPQISENLKNLVKNAPAYIESFRNLTGDLLDWLKDTFGFDVSALDNMNQTIVDSISKLASFDNVGKLFSAVTDTIGFFYTWIMAFVLSVYMLANKEFLCTQLKRLGAAFLPTKWMPTIYEIINVADEKCGKFLVSRIIDASIVGVSCFICMMILNLPYAPLISVIVAVCNIIPFFGPIIGGVPSAFLLLLVDPWDALIFVIMLFIIQQIDGNLVNPKIVGSKVGLIGFWSLFSVMVAGAMFGIPGMILGTPIFASIYTLIGRKTRKRIIMKGENADRVINMNVINSRSLTNVKVPVIKRGKNDEGEDGTQEENADSENTENT